MARRVYRGGSKAKTSEIFSEVLPEEMIKPSLRYREDIDIRTLQKEYTRMRDIAQKRVKRMEGKEEAQETYKNWIGRGFKTIKEIKEASRGSIEFRDLLIHNLGRVSNFLTARSGSLSGIRSRNKQILEALKEKKIDLTKEELRDFGTFMNAMKRAYKIPKGSFASDQTAQLWNEMNRTGSITQKEFNARIKGIVEQMEQERSSEEGKKIRLKKNPGIKVSSVFASDKLKRKRKK